jgi:hypothetical protein
MRKNHNRGPHRYGNLPAAVEQLERKLMKILCVDPPATKKGGSAVRPEPPETNQEAEAIRKQNVIRNSLKLESL